LTLFFVVALLGTGVMRLVELAVSQRRIGERPNDAVDERWLFPLMAFLHTALVALPLLEVFVLGREAWAPLFWASVGLLVVATILRVWTLSTIGLAWNVKVVRPPEDLVATQGPYRFIRHPNYLVVVLELIALPLLHTAVLSALFLGALNAFVLWHRIRTEEQVLMSVPAWKAAMGNKSRFIPGLF
jgi:methyltransferase